MVAVGWVCLVSQDDLYIMTSGGRCIVLYLPDLYEGEKVHLPMHRVFFAQDVYRHLNLDWCSRGERRQLEWGHRQAGGKKGQVRGHIQTAMGTQGRRGETGGKRQIRGDRHIGDTGEWGQNRDKR